MQLPYILFINLYAAQRTTTTTKAQTTRTPRTTTTASIIRGHRTFCALHRIVLQQARLVIAFCALYVCIYLFMLPCWIYCTFIHTPRHTHTHRGSHSIRKKCQLKICIAQNAFMHLLANGESGASVLAFFPWPRLPHSAQLLSLSLAHYLHLALSLSAAAKPKTFIHNNNNDCAISIMHFLF